MCIITGEYVIGDTDSLRHLVNKVTAAILGSTGNYVRFGAIILAEIEESEEMEMIRDGLVGKAELSA